MTEFLPAAEVPKTDEDRQHIVRRMGRAALESGKEVLAKESTRQIAGSLAILAAASTAAQVEHWFDHTDTILEFVQGSGRHFMVGYLGAVTGLVKSKAETFHGKVLAALTGAMAGDVLAEAGQSLVVTGMLHHGSLHDIMSFASEKEIFWGNAKDALAAELAVVPALAVEP